MKISRIIGSAAKFFGLLIFSLVLFKLVWIYSFKIDGNRLINGEETAGLLERRAFLIAETQNIDHIRSQIPLDVGPQIEGEMVISTCCMTTIALTNLSFLRPETRMESIETIRRLIQFVIAPAQREYDIASWSGEDPLESLAGTHGHTWYLGNVNFMIGAYKYLGGDGEFDSLMKEVTATLCRRYSQSQFPMLETYPHECYCTDNVIAIASLANAEKLLEQSKNGDDQKLANLCAKTVRAWPGKVQKQAIDPDTGAIAFRFDDGKIIQGGRGIGIGWNCNLLPFIDMNFAKAQYKVMKDRFVKKGLGIFAGLREYPNEDGEGDVDSGPVLLGLSMSGTGFAVGAARKMNDTNLISDISFTVESAGSTVSFNGKRHYLLSPLVGDAVMLAVYSSTPWTEQFISQKSENKLTPKLFESR